MKKFLGWYKGLPKEMQMALGLLGLGTPAGALYLLQRYIFPGVGIHILILGLVLVIGVVCLIGWLIPKVFGRASRQRQRRMESDLAASAEGGSVSMNLRAAVKSNNEKFFNAIREMKKLGISVYDLPWYVVIGDSGCGKTKLINEGGLTFSTGKPEGYQLGTLNYNWWFTEDAIFVDMAGRLCNPQDDGDYREWEAFLKTVGQGRRGYPINGVLLCISAEHLLQDGPEKHEQDANTMLERLRDLQAKLGVTFATYLVITKCDKIVGFMPFFDRAERDITIKNQIFGFSRAGEFSELYDPERFGEEFGALYSRLNELRLRRLSDDVDDNELGLAYSFPEEFRQLKEPLQTYVRTLFPAIKNPRAVKNLIFRGVYFTSATQQGGLILRHLTERLGESAANTFQPLESLYPRPRPHFVKELLFRKVFPEHGLVFRNEQEVMRNRKLSRLLMAGSGVLGVALAALLVVSALKFGALISKPREHANTAAKLLGKPGEALVLTREIDADRKLLGGSVWPTILSLGIGSNKPVQDLTTVQVGLFEHSVVQPVLAAADAALRRGNIAGLTADGARGAVAYDDYEAALIEYLRWAGCADDEVLVEGIDFDGFTALAGLLSETDGVLFNERVTLLEQAREYFALQRGLRDPSNPARFLAGAGFDPGATATAAMAHVHRYAERSTALREDSLDPVIAEWMRIRNRCATMETSYAAQLAAADVDVQTDAQLDTFRTSFGEQYGLFAKAMGECTWRGEQNAGFLRIPALREALRKQREAWLEREKDLLAAYTACGLSDDPKDPVIAAIHALMRGNGADLRGLDRLLAESIKEAGLAERDYFPDYYGEAFDKIVQEVDEAYAHILTVKRGADAGRDDAIELNPQLTGTIRPTLDKVHERLATLETGEAKAATAAEWVAALQRLLYPAETPDAARPDFAGLAPRWQGPKLQALNDTYEVLLRKGEGTVLLRTIETRLTDAGPLGFGELGADARGLQRSCYAIAALTGRDAEAAPVEKKAEAAPPVAKPRPGGPPPLVSRPKAPGAPDKPTPAPAAPERATGTSQIPAYATGDYLNARAMECVQLTRFLADFGPEHYFAKSGEARPAHQRCAELAETAWQAYCDAYAEAWAGAYKSKALSELKRVSKWDAGWEGFAGQFRATGAENEARNAVRDEFQPALAEILHATRWALFNADLGGAWTEQNDGYYDAQKRKIAGAFQAAFDKWGGGGFVRTASGAGVVTANDTKPWEAVAAAYAAKWIDWGNAAGRAARLPRKFDVDDAQAKQGAIPWSDLPALRSDTGLGDERITAQLVEFHQQAQALLSAELTAILAGVQADHFGGQSAYRGWPYVNEAGTGLTALETVPYDKYTKFLLATQRAEAAFAELEKGLPDHPLRTQRLAFLKGCADWREFLKLSAQGDATRLELSIWTEDPVGAPAGKARVEDGAQHYYKQVCLAIGLRRANEGAQALCFQTQERGKMKAIPAVWEWTRAPDLQELTFSLQDGVTPEGKGFTYPAIKPEVIGRPSPLALCAYLHRYGVFADGNWIVTHAVALADKLRESGAGQLTSGVGQIGDKFVIQLSRPLPEPIVPLAAAAAPAAPASTTGKGEGE